MSESVVKARRCSKEQLLRLQLDLSDRHRMWGWDCPAHDLDFVMCEYDHCQPVALAEYKNENAQQEDFSSANYKVLINLGERAKLPVFSVRYSDDFSQWIVTPLNDLARQWIAAPQTLVESEYIRLLYRIRRRLMPNLPFNGSKEISHQPKEDAA